MTHRPLRCVRQRLDFARVLGDAAMPTPLEMVEAAWDEEIARRIAEIDSGAVQCVLSETVMAELRATLR